MHFQYPAFLWALSLLAVPVIIHLFDFRRVKTVYFPSLRFLKHIEQRSSAARKLRDRLILAARMLVLAFLVLAFAKPVGGAKKQGEKGTSRVVSIFIDNSRSMEAVGPNGRLLDEARTRARELVSAYGLNDRFQLLTADFSGKQQRLMNRDEFLAAVDALGLSAATRTLPDIYQRQKALLGRENQAEKIAYIISDFQQNMRGNLAADSSIALHFVPLKANPLGNVSVDSTWFASPVHQPGQQEELLVKLSNNADKDAPGVPIRALINGQQKALGNVALKAHEQRVDTLRFSGLAAGWQRGQLRIGDYPVTFDDTLNIAFRVRSSLPVLGLYDQAPNRFVNAAYATDAFFTWKNQAAGQVDYSALNQYGLIVLSDVRSIAGGLAQQLGTYIRQGGSVLLSPSAEALPEEINPFLQSLGADPFLPVKKADIRTASISSRDPLFEGVFESVPKNMDLPAIQKHFPLNLRSRSGRQTLMEMDGREPLLARYPLGKGRLYLLTVPLDDASSNLPRHALFVPLLYRMAMLGLREGPLFYTAGRSEPVLGNVPAASEKEPLILSGEKTELIPELQRQGDETRLYTASEMLPPGLYKLGRKDAEPLAWLAWNSDRRESDLRYMDEAELQKIQGEKGTSVPLIGRRTPMSRAVSDANSGVALWKLCLLLALVCLLAETLLIRFMQPYRQPTGNPTPNRT
ncbi:MAG: BatA and WFA domain-containing protein [Mucilaginibacter polytrichastri]|nr:BatA and WFA domain-containing protein [Mucilaginibacter polytrichastri]